MADLLKGYRIQDKLRIPMLIVNAAIFDHKRNVGHELLLGIVESEALYKMPGSST
jgi:hypothetical protein